MCPNINQITDDVFKRVKDNVHFVCRDCGYNGGWGTYVEMAPNCSKCGSQYLDIFVSFNNFIEHLWKHTRKTGSWSKKTLPESKRDNLLMQKYIASKI